MSRTSAISRTSSTFLAPRSHVPYLNLPPPPEPRSSFFPQASMPLAASVRSEDSEAYLDSSEGELSRLQRQCRVMEAERQAYSRETQQRIHKQGGDLQAAAGAGRASGENEDLAEPSPQVPGAGPGEGSSEPPGPPAAAVQGGAQGAAASEEAGPTDCQVGDPSVAAAEGAQGPRSCPEEEGPEPAQGDGLGEPAEPGHHAL